MTIVNQTADKKFWQSPYSPTWCPGCGNFAIWLSLQQALTELNLTKEEVVFVCGVGCSGNISNTLSGFVVHGLHGRALPLATGIKLTNDSLKVIVLAGDGDTYNMGLGHFLQTCRRNVDLTVLVHDNQVYGLTTGQASPTSLPGAVTKTTPQGKLEEALNPLSLALLAGATFLARGFSGAVPQLVSLIKQAINHQGLSVVDVWQPCVTFNDLNTFPWFFDRVYDLAKENYAPTDFNLALNKILEGPEKLPIGLFYQTQAPVYSDKKIIDKNFKWQDLAQKFL